MMSGRIQIHTLGLWRLRQEIESITSMTPVRALPFSGRPDAVAGWGNKPTAAGAKRSAARRGVPYIAFEDGFLRSLHPGPAIPPASMITDRRGIYYDASTESDLEHLLQNHAFDEADLHSAKDVMAELRRHRLSKYNNGLERPSNLGRKAVLLIDQTWGDASIAGAQAGEPAFIAMVDAAIAENPGADIVVKLHPEVLLGRKRGYLRPLAEVRGLRLLGDNLNPWMLLEERPKVYTVSSQFGFEAILADCEVHCFGLPFYAGWGLSHDRLALPRRAARRSAIELAAAAYLHYAHYFDSATRAPTDCLSSIDQLAFQRRRYLGNTKPVVGYRIARRKRKPLSVLLSGPVSPMHFTRSLDKALQIAKSNNGAVAAWGGDATRIRQSLEDQNIELITVEDGYVRSVGLGAAFVPALSFCADRRGIYFDPSRSSSLEHFLETGEFDQAGLTRARALLQAIVESGITKYNLEEREAARIPEGKKLVLVVGQVASDQSVRLGAASQFAAEPIRRGGANLALLKAARARHPDAHLIYKPHPDVEAGLKNGRIPSDLALELCDTIAVRTTVKSLFALRPHVETLTSLAGFEALLRGLTVTCHGQPFYAGWGLTEDLKPSNRHRRLTLDQLVYGALIEYPRYVSPDGRIEISAEQALAVIRLQKNRTPDLLESLMAAGKLATGRIRNHLVNLTR
jgi:capsular polysaccharide export protein